MADERFSRVWPVPLIDSARCNGCGLCVRVCASRALAMLGDRVIVARPEACQYTGLCEMVCPMHAIERPFEIILSDDSSEKKAIKPSERRLDHG